MSVLSAFSSMRVRAALMGTALFVLALAGSAGAHWD